MITGPIILFDGVCNLCSSSVKFVIQKDRKAIFRFASLQSPIAKTLLEKVGFPTTHVPTIILVDKGRYFTESTAVLNIVLKLGIPWSLFYGLILVPKPIRDGAYRMIARNRYNWFGRTEQCMIPTADIQSRFLSPDEH